MLLLSCNYVGVVRLLELVGQLKRPFADVRDVGQPLGVDLGGRAHGLAGRGGAAGALYHPAREDDSHKHSDEDRPSPPSHYVVAEPSATVFDQCFHGVEHGGLSEEMDRGGEVKRFGLFVWFGHSIRCLAGRRKAWWILASSLMSL